MAGGETHGAFCEGKQNVGRSGSVSPWPCWFLVAEGCLASAPCVSFLQRRHCAHGAFSSSRWPGRQISTRPNPQTPGQFPHIRARLPASARRGKVRGSLLACSCVSGARTANGQYAYHASISWHDLPVETGLDVPISRRCNKTCGCSPQAHLFFLHSIKFSCYQSSRS